MKEIRAAARERMKGHCRVCPVCDGKACSGEVPGMGGLGPVAASATTAKPSMPANSTRRPCTTPASPAPTAPSWA